MAENIICQYVITNNKLKNKKKLVNINLSIVNFLNVVFIGARYTNLCDIVCEKS